MATATDDSMATNGDSVDTMAASGGISNVFKVIPHLYGGCLENAMVKVRKLYLRQIMAGPDANQSNVTNPNDKPGIGRPTGVSNWAIYDGAGSQANLVANGQGMYTRAGQWNQWFTLEFNNKVDERFRESTLHVMGANEDKENEWAIVGGTGEFAMARGIIRRRISSKMGDTVTQELTIEFFCCMKEVVVPAPTKRGPWGGNGSIREMEGKSQRLESVTINCTANVNYIKFSYIDEEGGVRTAGVWGENYGSPPDTETKTIKFGPLEWVKQISGKTAGPSGYVSQFQIVTNRKTYGPFGFGTTGTEFSYTVPEDETVVGFFAQTDAHHIRGIGIYTI